MNRSMVDKLMDMCDRHASDIAEIWYRSLSTNSRTSACLVIPKEIHIRHAVNMYKSISEMYFAEDCFRAVERVLDVSSIVDTCFARGVPLEQAQYSLILMRRHIWLYADAQLIFDPSGSDMYLAVDSINRILLVFDYAIYIFSRAYRELASSAYHDKPSVQTQA